MQAQYSSEVPEEIKGLNWGALLLNWIWAIGNQVWIGLLCLVPCIGFFMAIYLLIKGNELAWKGPRQWESVQQFKEVQGAWTKWGVILFAVSIVLNIGFSILSVMLGAMAGGRG
jgi:hypothetical protein